jgi:tetratricopeptide (TPR) repeat protein
MLAPLVFATLATAAAPASTTNVADELEKLSQALRASDEAERLAAAQKIAQLGVAALPAMPALPALIERLERPRQTSPDTFRQLFLAMWAQVPNWKSGDPMWIRAPEPPWVPPPRVKGQPRPKRPPPHDPETLDWLVALNTVDLDAATQHNPNADIPPPWVPPGQKKKVAPPPIEPAPTTSPAEMQTARGEALEVVALMRAIAATKQMDVVEPLFKVAFALDGVFRDECGRAIRSMDSAAVPSLVLLMHRDKALAKQRRYASYQLDRMDRARPSKAIATAPDDNLRAAIIHAYGETRALDAVEAVLNQVDSPSHRVRKEARWAWLRYVTGKAPPPAPKRKRKLPGGQQEAEEKPDYLTYREIATLALQKQLAAINNAPPDANASAKEMTDELFAYYDSKRAAEWDAAFLAAQEKEQRGDLRGATDEYGWILAHDPNYQRRGEMAHAFAHLGDSLRDQGEVSRALGAWRQAIDLAPDGSDARYAGARVALYDGLQELDHGVVDVDAFTRARTLDAALAPEADRALARARALHARRRWRRVGESAGGAALMIFVLWLLWRRSGTALPRGRDAQDQAKAGS